MGAFLPSVINRDPSTRPRRTARRLASLLLCVLACAPLAPARADGLPDFTSLVEKEGPAVVNISTTQVVRDGGDEVENPGLPEDDPLSELFRQFMQPQQPRVYRAHSLGSGFIINSDGYILTNNHVVAGAQDVVVRLTDHREFKAKVVGADERSDVALLKINATRLPVVRLGDSDRLKPGEWVVAIGSPFGFNNSVTAGIVSAKGRSLPSDAYVPFIQTDVPINPGNSGGPLFNLKGEVVGINSQIYSRTGGFMGLSFAIPINVAMQVSDQLRAHGKVTRGMLGVTIQEMTPALAPTFGLKGDAGVIISGVQKGSPAEKAGIRQGDVVLKIGGAPVASPMDMQRIVAATAPGRPLTLEVWRQRRTRTVTAVVGQLPSGAAARPAPAAAANRLGIAAADLSAAQKRRLQVTDGVLIVGAKGAAEEAGLQRGDVVLAINEAVIHNVEQFNRLVGQLPAKQPVALLVRRGSASIYLAISPSDGQ